MAHSKYEITDLRRYVTSGGFIDIDRGENERWIVPESIEAVVEFEGYRVEVCTGVDRTTLSSTITELRVIREPNGPAITELVRGPWTRVLVDLVDRAAVRMTRDPASGAWTSTEGVPFAAELAITRSRRSQREQIDREVQKVIDLWPRAQKERAPIPFLERELGLTRRTAQRRLAEAEKRMNREDN